MKQKQVGIPIKGGKFVLHGYDTEKDMLKACDDIERMLICLSQESLYEIMRFLAPYREKAARKSQAEYDDFAECAKNGQANKES